MTAQIIHVDPDNARTLARHATEIRRLGKQVVSDVIEIGRLLVESKKLAGHGNWLSWLEREFQWTDDTALNYMRVHDLVKNRNFRDLRNIPVSGLFLLAAPSTPEPAKREAISRAEAGEPVTLTTVKEIVGRAKQDDRRDAPVSIKYETHRDFIGSLIYGDHEVNLSKLITDYLLHLKRQLEKNAGGRTGPRPVAADDELRKAFQKEAIMEIWELQATYWHDDVVRNALARDRDYSPLLRIHRQREKEIEMKTTIIAIAAAAVLASSGAWAGSLTKEDEAIAQETEHTMNEGIMAICDTLSDVKGADFDRTAQQRHVAVTLDGCIKASVALAAEFERKPK